MKVRTRFAPSPTGYLHIGGARTALFSWLYARKHNGDFVLRIEDTDRDRSTAESVQAILDGMEWLGLDYDEGPYFQTKRYDLYQQVIDQLLKTGHAYRCYCSKERLDKMRELATAEKRKPRYDGSCRDKTEPVEGAPSVVRFRTPDTGSVIFNDLVKGPIEIDNAELDDLVICRSDGNPTYNLTVVADDIDMGITHVVRGDDHINNTPRQIHICQALGAPLPAFAHLPMILGDDGKRMSKRHGAVSVTQYSEDGILPDAMLSYLARLGWSHGDQELFSIAELKEYFALEDCQRSGSVFDKTKLLWVNQQHMAKLSKEQLGELLETELTRLGLRVDNGPDAGSLAELLRDRSQTMKEMVQQSEIYYRDELEFDPKAAAKHLRPVAFEVMQALNVKLKACTAWDADSLKTVLENVATELEVGFGKIGQPLRVALTGGSASPDIAATLEMVGQARSVQRVDQAIEFIRERREASAG
ncbi:glutamate--tRNA ligase [Chromatiales bacterium (ex Bugula neritina AB1)]|nr:glutamate--tRNA ligase [Chromatiales bacterium (ex Bugula neritina AB1)]